MTIFTTSRTAGWLSAADCSVDAFTSLLSQRTDLADYPSADAVERDVLIYGEKLRDAVGSAEGRTAVQSELIRALTDGPGIVVFKRAFGDLAVVDRATEAFLAQIAAEGRRHHGRGPLRQAWCATTGSGARWTSWPSQTPSCSRSTTPMTSSR